MSEYNNINKDQLIPLETRRLEGVFYTPIHIAKLAHEYVLKVFPEAYNNYWWDCCAGTGNLVYPCPSMDKLFISTLKEEDVTIMRESGFHPEAAIFQHDFLNDELPEVVKDTFREGDKWTILINPPFAAGADINTIKGGVSKKGVGGTLVGNEMRELKLGHASRNLYCQFIYRIAKLAKEYNLDVTLGIFTSLRWVVSAEEGGYKNFRKFLKECGMFPVPHTAFMFPVSEFHGTSGKFPVLFSVWQINANNRNTYLRANEVGDYKGKDFSCKVSVIRWQEGAMVREGWINVSPTILPLNDWVDRPKDTEVAPPMSSALVVKKEGDKSIYLDRIAENSIGYMRSNSNDVQNSQLSVITIGPNSSGSGWSITPDNFEKSMIVFAARKVITGTWLNDASEYNVPLPALTKEHEQLPYRNFVCDCIVWSLFANKNHTSSLPDVDYKGRLHTIRNQFFWMSRQEFCKISKLDLKLYHDAQRSVEPFAATYIVEHWDEFTDLAKELINEAHQIVINTIDIRRHTLPKYHLTSRWDAGWYQIRNGLLAKWGGEMYSVFREKHKQLGKRILDKIYDYRMLPRMIL